MGNGRNKLTHALTKQLVANKVTKKDEKMKHKKLLLVLIALLTAMFMSACGSTEETPTEEANTDTTTTTTTETETTEEAPLIGISMPTKSSSRWISDGESMVKVFTDMGYDTNLQFAEDDIPNQLAPMC
jgi:putative multiple sugar transport system substrate-binding protein